MKKETNSICAPGIHVNDDLIIIDYHRWTTQARLAKKLKVSRNVINNRIRRYEAAGLLNTYYIEQLDIRLIPNVMSINELCKSPKKAKK